MPSERSQDAELLSLTDSKHAELITAEPVAFCTQPGPGSPCLLLKAGRTEHVSGHPISLVGNKLGPSLITQTNSRWQYIHVTTAVPVFNQIFFFWILYGLPGSTIYESSRQFVQSVHIHWNKKKSNTDVNYQMRRSLHFSRDSSNARASQCPYPPLLLRKLFLPCLFLSLLTDWDY